LGEFRNSGWYQATGGRFEFPPACCPPKRSGKLQAHCHKVSRFGQGCYEKLMDSFHDLITHFRVVVWTVVAISAIQVVGIVVAFCLCNSIGEREYY